MWTAVEYEEALSWHSPPKIFFLDIYGEMALFSHFFAAASHFPLLQNSQINIPRRKINQERLPPIFNLGGWIQIRWRVKRPACSREGQKIRKSTFERGRQAGREEKLYFMGRLFLTTARASGPWMGSVLFAVVVRWQGFLPNIASSTIEINRVTHCYSIYFGREKLAAGHLKTPVCFFFSASLPVFLWQMARAWVRRRWRRKWFFKSYLRTFFSIQLCAPRMLQTCKKCHVRAKDVIWEYSSR